MYRRRNNLLVIREPLFAHPCPIDSDDKDSSAAGKKEENKSTKDEIENTMACTAYAEAGEPCPIDPDKKEDK